MASFWWVFNRARQRTGSEANPQRGYQFRRRFWEHIPLQAAKGGGIVLRELGIRGPERIHQWLKHGSVKVIWSVFLSTKVPYPFWVCQDFVPVPRTHWRSDFLIIKSHIDVMQKINNARMTLLRSPRCGKGDIFKRYMKSYVFSQSLSNAGSQNLQQVRASQYNCPFSVMRRSVPGS